MKIFTSIVGLNKTVKMLTIGGLIFMDFNPLPLLSAETAPSEKISLIDSERLAIKNHPALKLATEEMTVTKAKKDEAARALWPGITVKAEETKGMANNDLGTPEFKEQSYGVQLSQPLIQGGKLYRTYQQANSNWESSKAKSDKAERDVLYNVREAYWQMVRSGMAQEVYERALLDLDKERTRAEQLYKTNVITKETYLMIGSQYHQASLAIESAKAEREATLWRWTIALGLENPPDFEPQPIISINKADITVGQCLQLARKHNPDLRIQKNTMDASLFGYKAQKGNYWPRLGFNGFYGKSGGAYADEEFKLSEDWQVGVQLSQYLALNSLNVSGFQQKTSPKIGQSTRTETKTGSASLGVLDGFKTKSDIKDSAYAYHQAQTQLEQSELEILADVREAYANWKKGLTQLAFAENEVEWKKTEFRIAKIKTAHRDLPLSERAKLRNELALTEAALVAAQTNYNILQAALCKVVGVPDLFAKK
jgi:outer membrane protein TolC